MQVINMPMGKRKINMTDDSLVQFENCRILYRGNIIQDDLWVRNGKVMNPEKLFFEEKVKADVKIDCRNLIISPGFIDVQINGGFGCDFSSNTDKLEDALAVVGKGILQHGVTSFCPTLVTSPVDVYKQALPKLRRRKGGPHGAEVLGAHAEGPFINVEKKGAHNPDHIKTLNHKNITSVLDIYGSLENIAIVTVAPELDGALEAIDEIVAKNVVASIGHSVADLIQGEEAARRGATFITHLFNAMSPFHHRDPGIVGVLTSSVIPKPIFYGVIADGIHTHPTALRIAHRAHPQGLVLITDAIAAMGLSPGRHLLGTMEVDIDTKKAYLVGTKTLAGSIVTMDNCIRHFRKAAECTTVLALEAASLHPAQLLGITDRKGTLEYETDADLVILDEDLHINATFIAGRPVYVNKQRCMEHLDSIYELHDSKIQKFGK